MKVVQINTCDYGSTGKIMLGIASVARKDNIECYTFSRREKGTRSVDSEFNKHFGTYFGYEVHFLFSKLLGLEGFCSFFGTLCLLKSLKRISPEVVHLHNVHGNYINLPLLFRFIKKNKIKTIWTLHDCWSFTGRCPHFQITNCEKWKNKCGNCPYPRNEYPKMDIDRTEKMLQFKKKWFSGIKELILVTPSHWLADLVKTSYLKQYPVKVINNGINLEIFRPVTSDFRDKFPEKDFFILGVSFGWGYKKGLDVFIELSKKLPANYQIILVGTNDDVVNKLPDNIYTIHQTANQKELAKIYSAADVFINPTREDTYPTVNMEAIACGCPVVTFNTGGSPEMLNANTGFVLRENTAEEACKVIRYVCEICRFKKEDFLEHAKSFDLNDRFQEYVDLYREGWNGIQIIR